MGGTSAGPWDADPVLPGQWWGRDETGEERAPRMWTGLMQELRVAQAGVQILFGVLLFAVFQPAFTDLGPFDRGLYAGAVVAGAASTRALIGPVCLHRIVVGRRIKKQTAALASGMAKIGHILLAATTMLTLLLLLCAALDDTPAACPSAVIGVWLTAVWCVLSGWVRRHPTGRK